MFGSEFLELLKKDASDIEQQLKSYVDVVNGGIILRSDEASKASKKLLAEHCDAIVLFPIVWSADTPMLGALKEIDKSFIILWCHNRLEKLPERMGFDEIIRGSGPIGALQMSSALRRLGVSFVPVFGRGEPVLKDILEYSMAAKIMENLKQTRIGLLPWRYDEMVGTWIDEVKLLRELGPRIVHVSVNELYQVAQDLDASQTKAFVEQLKRYFRIEVSERSLEVSARACLALETVIEKHDLNAVAMQDLDEEMHRLLKTRPGIYTESMSRRNVAVGMEGDVHATLGMHILQGLTGKPAMFGEIFNYDITDNTLAVAHVGVLNTSLAKDLSKVRIIPDCEYKAFDEVEGAYTYFTCKEGIVTLLSIVDEGHSYRMITSVGESIPTEGKLEGYAHMVVKIRSSVKHFFETAMKFGANQHWAVVHGDVTNVLEKLARLLGIEITTIT